MDSGSLALAVGAGTLAAVNPCGFALLPAYLSLFVLDHGELPRRQALLRALRATAALTLGFAGVFLVFGLLIAPVAASVQSYLPGFTVALGLALALAGLWVALGRRLPSMTLRLGRSRPGRVTAGGATAGWLSMTTFGAGYAIASLGCTIAPFLAVVVAAFRSGSTLDGLALFVAYAAGMGLVVGVAAVATALTRRGLLTHLRRAGGILPRVGGVVLLVAGAYVAWYGVWELRVLHGGAGTDPVVEAAGGLQRWVSDRVDAVGAWGFAGLLAVVVLVGLGWGTRRVTRGAAAADRTLP